MAYIEFNNVCKDYENEKIKIKALKKVNFKIEKGELVIITGPSCSGKTSCLNILGAIDKLTSGEVVVGNQKINELKNNQLIDYRRNDVGFVFQSYNLIEDLTVMDNVCLSTRICKDKIDEDEIIKKLGLTKRKNDFIFELSSSQQQLTAIARAIAKKPKILLCDELDLVLDEKNGKQVLKLLQSMIKKEKMTVIITTRKNAITQVANKIINIKNGNVIDIKINKKPKAIGDLSW